MKRLLTIIITHLVILLFSFIGCNDEKKPPPITTEDNLREFQEEIKVITDSDYTLEEALTGAAIPDSIKKTLTIVEVEYLSFDSLKHKGQLVVNKKIADEVKEIFNEILESGFFIEKVIPVALYNWSDEESMLDNNTSCFNYRIVAGTRVISKHASGLAIDINPRLNPQIKYGKVIPEAAEYNTGTSGTISGNLPIVNSFKKRGWQWGGNWKSTKDYQHFEKK